MAKWTYRFKQKPDACQLEALKRALRQKRFGIFFEQRVGKSRVAVDFCGVRHIAEGDLKVLIVAPLSVRYTWVEQFKEYMPDYIDYDIFITPKTPQKRWELLKKLSNTLKLSVVVTNYDVLPNDVDKLIKWSPDIVIFDEGHMIGGHTSKRSKAAYKLSKYAKCVLVLTGTPIPNKREQLFGLFRALDDTVFGANWAKFRERYCIMGGYMGKQIIGYKNEKEMAYKVGQHSMRVLRRDVMTEPEVENILVPVDLEPKAREQYRKLRDAYIIELEAGGKLIADMAGVRVMRLQQFCGGYVPDEDGTMINVTRAKLEATVDLVESIVAGDEKVLIFARFTAEIRELHRMLAAKKIHTEVFDGSTSEEMRHQIRLNFQTKAYPQVVIMQIGTGVMGLQFDRAHTNIFYSLDYRLTNLQQAKDRVMGRGQKSPVVTNYFMAVKGTVDNKIMRTLKNNEDLAKRITDDWRWIMKEED